MRIVAAHITANALRGHVSFLASDLLEGRDTPSRGLDVAGEYIAAQFRRFGLEPGGDDGYFQTVTLKPDDPDSPKSRNVAGILRGSDPALRETYVLLSSHYDHVGLAKGGADLVFNGANDDASGTASVLESAYALASLHPRPRRSVVFVLFCGEEKGLLGSKYYARHPVVPLEKTIAHLNLEQMGRTDSSQGPQLNSANVTGFDFSDIPKLLVDSGRRIGVTVSKVDKAGDDYFNRSDNGPLAIAGVPAHTMSVTYGFPDYHKPGDEWQKLDYDNMAKVTQAVGIGMLRLAQAVTAPKWSETYAPAKAYVEAGRKLNGK
ncbi:MAG: M20/M25/M40 family metallo-hydrolase [Bryobacterales bacterium]|nr:M20/M25/M40 family metallo-hydrolase [Bryobacterales bacterium]